ncbi:MAG: glucose-6-phosphate dehydrogenase [Arachnia propionica]|nr:MAG: glucose-6-phosphate dehydrogenase [Arachnia propionica]
MPHNPLRDPRDQRLYRMAEPCVLVLFGVTGDLSRKKLLPAVYDLANRRLLPPGFSLVGFARRSWNDEEFAEQIRQSVIEHARTPFREDVWQHLKEGIRFVSGTFTDEAAFDRLRATVQQLDQDRGTLGNRAYYLSIPPRAFETVVSHLQDKGLAEQAGSQWRRIVIEKPFGHDLASAQALADVLQDKFDPEQVFRIDHYLGKETVQNLLALRFANQMFEPIWNNRYLSHVQVTMAEDIGIAGRGGYYDGVGAARDVIQNHLLQLLALTAMEEPTSFEAAQLRLEKQKVLAAAAVPPDYARSTARGQYAAGWQGGNEMAGYLAETGVDPASTTETYAAIRVDIANRRWAGVPFYLRAAKRMPRRVTEVALSFKPAPHLPFSRGHTSRLGTNALVLRIQPDDGITLRFGAKVPGTEMDIREVSMDFAYGGSFTESSPEAYERLILDVLLGEPPLFPRQEEVELSWRILDPVLDYWASLPGQPEPYASGTWGPPSGDELLRRDGFAWRRP